MKFRVNATCRRGGEQVVLQKRSCSYRRATRFPEVRRYSTRTYRERGIRSPPPLSLSLSSRAFFSPAALLIPLSLRIQFLQSSILFPRSAFDGAVKIPRPIVRVTASNLSRPARAPPATPSSGVFYSRERRRSTYGRAPT